MKTQPIATYDSPHTRRALLDGEAPQKITGTYIANIQ